MHEVREKMNVEMRVDLFFDSEFRKLIPPLQLEEYSQLVASLRAEGNRDPVVIWKETRLLLDGHSRYDICQKHSIPLKPPMELSFPDRDAAKIWIIQNQFGRRNLSPYQRSVLALEMMKILEAQAKAKESLRKTAEQTKPALPMEYLEKYVDILAEHGGKEHPERTSAENLTAAIDYVVSHSAQLPSRHAAPEFTYFVQAGQNVKIGSSSDPEGRLKEITKHVPEAVLLGYCKGGQPLETEIHEMLKEHLSHHEWYKMNEFTISIIKSFIRNADFVHMDKVNSRENATQFFGVGAGTIARVKLIEAKASVEQKAKLVAGQATVNQVYVQLRREEVKEQVKKAEWPTGKYRVIYADPPWQYSNSQPDYHTVQDDHYPTIPISEICALPVSDLALDDAVLFLWATSPILEESFKVIHDWGFKYKASFVWDKVKHNMGHYNSIRHEFLLIAVRGSCQPDNIKLFDSVQTIERTDHSAKPEAFRTIIDTLYPYGKRIELFARAKADGWEQYGNQIS